MYKFEKLSKEEYLEAVKSNGYALRYVKDQDKELCLEAVKSNSCALQYVKDQDKDICLEAVKSKGCALQYVKDQDKDICIEAVKNDGYALRYVKEQDKEICLEAVKNDGLALRYVEEFYDEITKLSSPFMTDYIEAHKKELDEFMTEIDPQNKLNKIEDLILEFDKNSNLSSFEVLVNIKKIIEV